MKMRLAALRRAVNMPFFSILRPFLVVILAFGAFHGARGVGKYARMAAL